MPVWVQLVVVFMLGGTVGGFGCLLLCAAAMTPKRRF
jgi:hypothetical protein